MYWRNKRTLPFTIVRSEGIAVLLFASFALLGGFLYTGIDNAAHLGGLITGLLLGFTLSHAKRQSLPKMQNRLPALKTLLVATAVLACGFWGALHSSAAHQPAAAHDSTKI